MNIFVNKQPLNFELTNEISFTDILGYITNWAKEQNLFILNYVVAPLEDYTNIENNELISNQIKDIHFELGEARDIYYETIKELDQYIDKMGSFLANKIQDEITLNTDDINMIQTGLLWIDDALTSITSHTLMKVTDEIKACIQIIHNAAQPNTKFNYANIDELMSLIESLGTIKCYSLGWSKIWQFYGASKEELNELLKAFFHESEKALTSLEGIATNLTVGKETQALLVLEKLVDFLSDGLAILHLSNVYQAEREKMLAILNQLIFCLDKGDMTNAADLIDYDLKEILEFFVSIKIN